MNGDPSPQVVRVYVWEIPVRITHWLIAGSIVLLSITGFYIGRPFVTVSGPAGDSFLMGWVKVVHGYTAYVFITAVLVRMIWMFTGNRYARWDKFIPVRPERRHGLWPTLKVLSVCAAEAAGVRRAQPVAGATYTAVSGSTSSPSSPD